MLTVHTPTVHKTAPLLGKITLSLLGLAALVCVAPAAQAQAYVYTLSNTYAPADGGPSLTPNGGTLSASGYTFGKDQGLSLSNAFNGDDYSISMTFSLTSIDRYDKLLDFSSQSSDGGLYLYYGQLDFYPATGAPGATTLVANQSATVNLTRSAATQVVTGSIDGIQQFSFVDSTDIAVFNSPGALIDFFEDDNVTGQREATGGTVTNITVSGTSAPVPEASTTVSLGLLLALGGVVIAAKRRKTAS